VFGICGTGIESTCAGTNLFNNDHYTINLMGKIQEELTTCGLFSSLSEECINI